MKTFSIVVLSLLVCTNVSTYGNNDYGGCPLNLSASDCSVDYAASPSCPCRRQNGQWGNCVLDDDSVTCHSQKPSNKPDEIHPEKDCE